MQEWINKKLRAAKTFRICLGVVFILFLLSCLIVQFIEIKTVFWPGAILMGVLLVGVPTYFGEFYAKDRNLSWLTTREEKYQLDDIDPQNANLPQSKISCGQQCFFCSKEQIVLPYAEIGWMYVHIKAYGIVPIEKKVIVRTKGGKKFAFTADEKELQWLLEKAIVLHSPNVILGYGAAQMKRYHELRRKSQKR